MSIIISATGISAPDADTNSILHASRAGLACLENAGSTVEDVDFLTNVSIYRHHNMCEPSTCALIQHEMKMCPDARKFPVKKNVFSFDLNNGGCGVLSAVMALSALLHVRKLEHALILGADCHPSGLSHENYPFTPMGGAVLISRSEESDRGFQPIWLRTSPQPLDGQSGSCDIMKHGAKSRNSIDVVRAPGYLEKLQDFTREIVSAYLEQHNVERENLKLVCSQPSATFGTLLAEGLGLPATALIPTFPEYGDVHTSSLSLGYHVAQRDKHVDDDSSVLFVEAGGGLTVGCTLYR